MSTGTVTLGSDQDAATQLDVAAYEDDDEDGAADAQTDAKTTQAGTAAATAASKSKRKADDDSDNSAKRSKANSVQISPHEVRCIKREKRERGLNTLLFC
jgi:hypothetical protein